MKDTSFDEVGQTMYDLLRSKGAILPQVESPIDQVSTAELRKNFPVIQLFAKKFETYGWTQGMVDTFTTNMLAGIKFFAEEKLVEFLTKYYQRKIERGNGSWKNRKIGEIKFPTAEEVLKLFEYSVNSKTETNGTVTIRSIEIVWLKEYIECLSGFWPMLMTEAKAPLTKTVYISPQGKKSDKDASREVTTMPEYRLIKAKSFFDFDDNTIGKKGFTVRFIIPDGGNFTGYCDVFVGKQFIPPNSTVKWRPHTVEYEKDPVNYPFIKGETIHKEERTGVLQNGETVTRVIETISVNQDRHTTFYPFDYSRATKEYARNVRWSNSWTQIIMDFNGYEMINNVKTPIWNVIADGQQVIFATSPEGKSYPRTVSYFARDEAEASADRQNGKTKVSPVGKGWPVDLLAEILGDEIRTSHNGVERVIRPSGMEICYKLGFLVDHNTIAGILEHGEKFANGEVNSLESEFVIPRRQDIERDTEETNTVGDFVNKPQKMSKAQRKAQAQAQKAAVAETSAEVNDTSDEEDEEEVPADIVLDGQAADTADEEGESDKVEVNYDDSASN